MIIEIRGAGFLNKGAELMLLAILEHLRAAYPHAVITAAPTGSGGARPVDKLAALGIRSKASLVRRGVELGDLARVVPRPLRARFGLIIDPDIDVVLDASGFAYSDQWGAGAARELARCIRRWKRRQTKVVLLPQAFGPFENRELQDAMKAAIAGADLVMPRDDVSSRYLRDLVGSDARIQQFPDFTNLVAGTVPGEFDVDAHQVAVVPNARMLDKTDTRTGAGYLPFLTACARELRAANRHPFLLVHEGAGDARLAEQVAADAGGVPVVHEQSALAIKGILGACRAVVASRFHALVSALSQGVPAVATGWSHKYAELFNDYGFPEGVMSTDTDEEQIAEMMTRITDETRGAAIASTLDAKSAQLKLKSEAMWKAVDGLIEKG